MKPFENVTHDGNEKAIRKGRVVPEGDVNLAYTKAPELSPKNNVVIVDTSRIAEENVASRARTTKLYYANPIGVLVDEDDNVAISDEYPIVTDVFSIDEDFSEVPGNEYTNDSILPFRHVSRYFHLDYAGLALSDDLISYEHDSIKIVDSNDNEHPNYRIKITPVYVKGLEEEDLTSPGKPQFNRSTWAYRVYAYIDTEENEDLFLTYNKIEINNSGNMVRRQIGYKEILNPQPFFSYTPEESDVVDPANREEKIFSSKPLSFKEQILGGTKENIDGYKVYVPRKALGDPRLYQLFRWRIKCRFVQDVTVNPSRDFSTIRCGVLVTNKQLSMKSPSRSPYAFYNLERSRYNAKNVKFINPAQSTHSSTDKEYRDYWFVNLDTDDLSDYDILIWSPNGLDFNYSPYAAKLNDFVSTKGGTVFIDTNTFADAFRTMGGRTTKGINPNTGQPRSTSGANNSTANVRADFPRWGQADHILLNANAELGGWDFNTSVEERLFIEKMQIENYDGSLHTRRDRLAGVLMAVARGIEGFPIPARKSGAFTDVSHNSSNASAIERLANFPTPVALGNTDGGFNPLRNATRAQVASFFDRLYTNIANHFSEISAITPTSGMPYSDVGSNFAHAAALRRMHASGIMIGYPDGTFRAMREITQHQLSLVVARFLQYLRNQTSDFISDIDASENIYFMSYTQSHNRKYSQNFHVKPSGYTEILEARMEPGSDTHRSVTVARQIGGGHKILSTFGHLYTCSALINYVDNAIISGNMNSRAVSNDNYTRHINGIGVEGAMKLLYNASLLAVRGRALDSADPDEFSTSWAYYTPWRSSWAIDASDGVLNDLEKSEHDFFIDARDVHAGDTTPVWKRRLSHRTVKELVDEALEAVIGNNQSIRNRTEGAAREYSIEITNPYVEVGSKVIENDYPQAWTEAYTPRFTVPVELGPHIVKEETDETGQRGRVAQYDDMTYMRREYPEKPYSGRVTATYTATEEMEQTSNTNYTATGTAVATTRITNTTPAKTTTKTSNITLNWVESNVSTRSKSTRGSPTNSTGTEWDVYRNSPHLGWIHPTGITAWQNNNYYTNDWGPGHLNFPYWGETTRIVNGSSGNAVRRVQDAYNRLSNAGYFSTSRLVVDGKYGPKTRAATINFQKAMKARWVDGVVDAETWSLIGIQIHRAIANRKFGSYSTSNWQAPYSNVNRLEMHRISNGNSDWSAKRSWRNNGPSIIWELYAIRFRERYNWHGITIVPWVGGNYDRLMWRSIHVLNMNSTPNLRNYNSTSGQLKYMPHRPRNGQSFYVPFGPYRGNGFIIGIGQDKSSGFGSARMMGLRDVKGHAKVTSTTTIPSKTTITTQQEDITFTVSGSISVTSFNDRTIQLQPPKFKQYDGISNVRFNSITSSNPYVIASVDRSGLATFRSQIVENNTGTEVIQGPRFPRDVTAFSMDENGRLTAVRETGWVSKADGIKLLCDRKKRPIGIPGLPNPGELDAQMHYVKMSIGTSGTDNSVQMGFYDFARKEFIVSVDGKPEISFIEFLKRGPHNIFIAVVCDYEKSSQEVIPVDEDAPRLPYRWAMPVYGVTTRSGSKITLESLPDRLGPRDVWPIAVREGKFTRDIKVRERWEGSVLTYLQSYQGTNVKAFYGIPEADLGGYSEKFGPPNADVIDEEPIILDDDVIQVRQAPILMERFPTLYPNISDPVRPVVTLFKRPDRNSPWEEQPFSEIRDFNASTGELFLRQRLTSNDSTLLRVDYTTSRRAYHFKKDGDLLLNLNSWSGHTRHLIGEAIYVYIVPHFVKDEDGRVIPGSLQERTLRVSLEPGVFDPLMPEYDPLAVPLGVVYISTALDISELGMFDTRRRGGGIHDSANVQELTRLVNDAATYWDIGYATSGSYQKSGYIVIRLPEELKQEFSEEDIIEVVERNVSSGIGFKLETLQGEDW